MAIIRQHDKRSGITYAYESQSYWDPVKKMTRAKRKLIGRVDPETNEIKKIGKSIKSSSFYKRASNSTYKNDKIYDKDKCNTFRESNEIKNKIMQDELDIKNCKKKKNAVFKNINNKNETDNKISLNNNLMQENKKDYLINNVSNNKTIVAVCHNKTINHIRIKNPKLNSVLCNYYENQSFKNKLLNSYLPIRNYNSLNKSGDFIKTENSKYIENEIGNKSFREKGGKSDKYFDSSNLKMKLKKNNSIEKGYINFYKVNKKSSKNINENKYKLNLTDINNKEDYYNDNIEETHNIINTISCFNEIRLNNKENETKSYNDEIKNTKKNNYDIIKKNKIKNNKSNKLKNEKENNKNMKKKSKTTYLKINSKSVGKRNTERNTKNSNMNMKSSEKKENNLIKKLSDIAESSIR